MTSQNKICEVTGFVGISRRSNMKKAPLQKVRLFRWIDIALLRSDDSIQIFQFKTGLDRNVYDLGLLTNHIIFTINLNFCDATFLLSIRYYKVQIWVD